MILFLGFLVAASAAPTPPFRIDTLIPGEGAESDCATMLWRAGAKPASKEAAIPDVFERVDTTAWIKIDAKVHTVTLIKSALGKMPLTFSDATTSVELRDVITRTDKSSDGNTYHLKGTLKVTYRGNSQTLEVAGEDVCYSGG